MLKTVAVLALLIPAACSSEEFAVTGSPEIAFVGEAVSVQIEGPLGPYKFRLLQKTEGEDWDFDAEWEDASTVSTVLGETGTVHLNYQVMDSAGEVVANSYIGSVEVSDPDRATALMTSPYRRFVIASEPSRISSESAEAGWRQSVRSIEDLHRHVLRVAKKESDDPSDLEIATTAMQVVSGLWAYGNEHAVLNVGCIGENEIDGKTRQPIAFMDYLEAPIGCCTDYAALLAAILTFHGMENRVVNIPGHVFNEAKIDGEWWTLDANINVLYEGPWSEVSDGFSKVHVTIFSHAGIEAGSPIYRESLAGFRIWVLNAAASGLSKSTSTADANGWGPVSALLN